MTGIGLRTGLGNERETTWRNLREGRQRFRVLDFDRAPGSPQYVGCPLDHSDHRPFENLYKTALEALGDSGLDKHPYNPEQAACVIGMSKGDLCLITELHREMLEGKPEGQGLDKWWWTWPSGPATRLSDALKLYGPCLAPVAACATGLIAALRAADLIRHGVSDLAIAGATDASLTPFLLGGFRNMGLLACVNEGDDPGRAVRPWDRNRTGFLPGEGAAVLVLESEEHARARGALPYAEFCGGAYGSDAFHETNLSRDPASFGELIGRALRNAGVDASEIDHVNVHATGTQANDSFECQALRHALGEHADRVACSANKAQTGHLLGASGAAELAFAALAIRDEFVPPTLNLDDPDPLCDLDGTPHVGRSLPIRAALKTSIGFGGHLAAAVLRRPEEPRRGPEATWEA